MAMKNPPHPGRSIKDSCLDPLNLSVMEGAERLSKPAGRRMNSLGTRALECPSLSEEGLSTWLKNNISPAQGPDTFKSSRK